MKNYRKGLTLIELMLVIFIISIASVFVVPKLGNVMHITLKTEARYLAGTIKYAHNEATLKKQLLSIQYNLDEGSYSITSYQPHVISERNNNSQEDENLKRTNNKNIYKNQKESLENPWTPYSGASVTGRKFSEGIRFEDVMTKESYYEPVTQGTTYTLFRPDGFAEPTWIHLVDDDGSKLTLEIQPLTGTTKIYYGYIAPNIER